MKFGVEMFPTDYSMPVTELAKEVEARGFESLWFPEHTHIPASRRSPWPGGASLPQEYWHTLDPFAAIGAAAAVTTTLKFGTGICLVIERDTITLAKEIASVDHISNGRFLFGIGGGWNYEEMENHGTNPKTRWRKLREQILAMKEIWTKDEAEFHGEFVNFDKIWQWPKPVQKPHPPVIIGGDGPRTFDRILEYGDEWMPIGGRRGEEPLETKIDRLQKMAAERGRGRIPISMFGSAPNPANLAKYSEMGVDRVIFGLPSAQADTVLPLLDRCAEVAKQFS